MGRKKFMLEGALRGRNELIQDSIRRDTGIIRDRKQVSSHLQVLKQHLHNQPGGKWHRSFSASTTRDLFLALFRSRKNLKLVVVVLQATIMQLRARVTAGIVEL